MSNNQYHNLTKIAQWCVDYNLKFLLYLYLLLILPIIPIICFIENIGTSLTEWSRAWADVFNSKKE